MSFLSGTPVVLQFNSIDVIYHVLSVLKEATIKGDQADLHAIAISCLHKSEPTEQMLKRLKEEFSKEATPQQPEKTGIVPAVPTGAAQRKFPQSSGANQAQTSPAPTPVRVQSEEESGGPRSIKKVEPPAPPTAEKKEEPKSDSALKADPPAASPKEPAISPAPTPKEHKK
jgi:hypothetical protein